MSDTRNPNRGRKRVLERNRNEMRKGKKKGIGECVGLVWFEI